MLEQSQVCAVLHDCAVEFRRQVSQTMNMQEGVAESD